MQWCTRLADLPGSSSQPHFALLLEVDHALENFVNQSLTSSVTDGKLLLEFELGGHEQVIFHACGLKHVQCIQPAQLTQCVKNHWEGTTRP